VPDVLTKAPRRIQLSRRRGYRKAAGAVVVSRPSIWGNPFRVGDKLGYPFADVLGPVVRDRAHAVEVFTCYARITAGYAFLARRDLRGRDLACWCQLPEPGQPDICHAAILLRIANSITEGDGDGT
jgi:hypothetical protein